MKFNIYFTIMGPGGILETPNTTNPVEFANLESLLVQLAGKLLRNDALGLETVGLRIEPVAQEER